MNFPENQINPYTEHFCLARFITLRIKYHFIKDVHLHFSSFFLLITSQTFTVNAITCPSGVLFCPILLCWMACLCYIYLRFQAYNHINTLHQRHFSQSSTIIYFFFSVRHEFSNSSQSQISLGSSRENQFSFYIP